MPERAHCEYGRTPPLARVTGFPPADATGFLRRLLTALSLSFRVR